MGLFGFGKKKEPDAQELEIVDIADDKTLDKADAPVKKAKKKG